MLIISLQKLMHSFPPAHLHCICFFIQCASLLPIRQVCLPSLLWSSCRCQHRLKPHINNNSQTNASHTTDRRCLASRLGATQELPVYSHLNIRSHQLQYFKRPLGAPQGFLPIHSPQVTPSSAKNRALASIRPRARSSFDQHIPFSRSTSTMWSGTSCEFTSLSSVALPQPQNTFFF